MKKGYKYRIYPNAEQAAFIRKCCGAARFVYNYALRLSMDMNEEARAKGEKYYYNSYSMNKIIRRLKDTPDENGDYPYGWLKEIDSDLIDYALEDLKFAYEAFYRNVKTKGFNPKHADKFKPKFKKKGYATESYTSKKRAKGNNIRLIDDRYIKLPKMTPIRIILHRPIPEGARITKATVSITKAGNFYVSLSLTVPDVILPNDGGKVGIDVGLKEFYSDSNGNKVANPKFLKRSSDLLRKRQRRLTKQMRSHIIGYSDKSGNIQLKQDRTHNKPVFDKPLIDCKNFQKRKKQITKLHEHVANQRAAFHDDLSAKLAKENAVICMEDLKIQNMQKNHKLAGSISDVGWFSFKQKVDYKVKEHGGVLVSVPTFFPSSQTCSVCGYQNKDVKKLSVRKWKCPSCNTEHDRDINAGQNILQKGLEMLGET